MLQDLHPGIRVLLMSVYNEDFITRRGDVDKEINFFHKPFTPGSLKQKVRELLDGWWAQGPAVLKIPAPLRVGRLEKIRLFIWIPPCFIL